MEKSFEEKYHVQEENNWWFESRRDIIYKLLRNMRVNKNARILDVGCSGGAMIRFLNKKGFNNIYGIDISKKAIEICKKRGIKNVSVMDAAKPKFKSNEFDIVIASDILEHIENEKSALSEWRRVLKENGRAIIFVPAHQSLWSEHDVINKHYRRYNRKSLLKVVRLAGFDVKRDSYWNFFMFFPTFFIRMIQRKREKGKKNKAEDVRVHHFGLNSDLNFALISMLKIENVFLKYLDFPTGVSFFVIARKKS